MQQIEEKMAQSRPLLTIEQRIQDVISALSNFRKSLQEKRVVNLDELKRELEAIIRQFEAIPAGRQPQTNELLSGTLRVEIAKLQQLVRGDSVQSVPVRLLLETAAVQRRIAAIASEQAQAGASQGPELALERESLLVQQRDLLVQLRGALPPFS
jgi:hypothetical protein